MIIEMSLKFGKNKTDREELFNLRNKACQEAFYEETETNKELLSCVEDDLPVVVQANKWKKAFNNVLHKCFKKIRIVKKKDVNKTDDLLKERIKLKNNFKSEGIDDEMKTKIKERIKHIEDDIGEEIAIENYKVIMETMKELGDENNMNGSGRKKLWNLLKKKFPKASQTIPVAKKDRKGNLISNHKDLKELYLKTYTQRL